MVKQDKILKALANVRAPDGGGSIVEQGMVSGLQVLPRGEVVFMIEVDPQRGAALEPLRQEAERVVLALRGVKKVSAVLTAEKVYASSGDGGQGGRSSSDPHGMDKNPVLDLPIKNVVVVSSGKGGVGKSTVSAAIARCLAENSQLRVGILDADIYGPSQPKLMGLEGCKPEFTQGNMIIPPVVDVSGNVHGLKVMSIGFMVDSDQALVWRGPMVQSAIYQLFRDVQWGDPDDELDVLIVDMPPGTGDAQLTLAQKIPVTGAVVVSTPQDIALIDARKGVEMFNKTGVPILGMVENMSTHVCSHCGHEEHVFGYGGGRLEAERLGIPFLGEIPLSLEIRERSDAGQPVGAGFEGIVSRLVAALEL